MTPTTPVGTPNDHCDHCGKAGELGANMRAHAVEIPGKQARTVRMLHVERCTAEWFAKFNAWVIERGKPKTSPS